MNCPHCNAKNINKIGVFSRKSGERFQRWLCKRCKMSFSRATGSMSYRQKRPDLEESVFHALTSGVSQRRTAILLGTTPKTVARKLERLAYFGRKVHELYQTRMLTGIKTVVFDEMETHEHTKCKPLSIVLAVEEGSRRIIAGAVARMPAKGKLAAISRKKYGRRADHRGTAITEVLAKVATLADPELTVKSDQCPRYPAAVKQHLPGANHVAFKGRRGCIVGQGELKRGGFDPLFALNHTCAMFRDNIKRLSRRTWCTTKRPDRLQFLIDLYICAHNAGIECRNRAKRFVVAFAGYLPARLDPNTAM